MRDREDTLKKVAEAWENLFNERDRLWRSAEDKLDAIVVLLKNDGCSCDCEHHSMEHDDDCERCLACQINSVLLG